jgi:hypothetical protein
MQYGAYEVHIPSISGASGVKGGVIRKTPSTSFSDFLPSIPPPKLEGRIQVDLPPNQKVYGRQHGSWELPYLTPEEEVEFKIYDPKANLKRWRYVRDATGCGKGQDRRKMSTRIARQKQDKWNPKYMGIKPDPEMKGDARTWEVNLAKNGGKLK